PTGSVASVIGVAGDALGHLGKVVGELAGLARPLFDALAGIPTVFMGITETLVSFAAKASPGLFRSWQIALDDVQAVIGHSFVPVLELMRDGVRLFGDVLANLLPNTNEVRSALSEFQAAFASFGREIRVILAEIGPSIRDVLIEGLQQLAHWLAVATRAVVLAVQRLRAAMGGVVASSGRSLQRPWRAEPKTCASATLRNDEAA